MRAELVLGGLDAHRKASAGHAERLHEPGDFRSERLAGAAACLGQTAGRLSILALERCEGAFAFGEALLRALQRADFLEGALELRRQLEDAQAVLARERLERRGLALDLLLPRRVHVERIEIVPQGLRGLAHENGGFAEQLRRRPELGVHIHRGTQRSGSLGEEVVRARALLVVHGIERAARRLSQPPAAGDALLLREQRLDVGGRW